MISIGDYAAGWLRVEEWSDRHNKDRKLYQVSIPALGAIVVSIDEANNVIKRLSKLRNDVYSIMEWIMANENKVPLHDEPSLVTLTQERDEARNLAGLMYGAMVQFPTSVGDMVGEDWPEDIPEWLLKEAFGK